MSKVLIVNNTSFDYPEAGDPKGWGEEATAWASEVTAVIGDLKGPNDIIQTSFTIANNTLIASDVVGLTFDAATVRMADISYSVYRVTDSAEINESGTISIQYYSNSGTWDIGQDYIGDASTVFSITNAGQVQYTSSNLAGLNYEGTITFRAKTLDQ